MAAVAGLRGTGDFSANERPKNFREMILFLNPNGSAPLFALTSKVRKRTVSDPEYNWWDEPNDLVRLRVNGAIGSTITDVIVNSVDPTATTLDAGWGVASHLKPGDMLLVEPLTDSATFNQEVIQVQNVISDTEFTATRGAMGTSAATIPDQSFLLLIASAYAEGTAAPRAVSRNPIMFTNKTQIFKDTYELTGTTEMTFFRTGDPWSNDKKRKMFDHSRAIEWSMLFGRVSEVTGSNGKPMRTMNGIRAQLPSTRQTVFTTSVTWNQLLDTLFPVFNFDTPAGDERIAFVGNGALNALNKIISADANSQIFYGGPVEVYGMNFREMVLPQGRILLRSHPLLNRHPLYTNSMWVLDFASITYVTLKGRDTRTKDDVQLKDEDLRRGFIQTECSLEVDRGGLTCQYIGGIQP
jgi:Family of unknown function (DUF5309)